MSRRLRGTAGVSVALTALALLGGAGCGDVVNCLTNPSSYRTAELKAVDVPTGRVGAVYQAELRGSIDNESDDDSFSYEFTLKDGVLPPGTTLIPDGRSVFVTGLPTLAGVFAFTMGVHVDPSPDAICNFDGDPSRARLAVSIEIQPADAP
ncbi:MAG: hypothetical protein IPK07_06670 [Deltaproteobacteria bacterium]|nr:hypothetical protein [Deltaproteobacteria bacterium]